MIYTPIQLVAEHPIKGKYPTQSIAIAGVLRKLIGPIYGKPRAIIFRNIATPNYEILRFFRLCKRAGFDPTILQYSHDSMSWQNQNKRALVSPMIVDGMGVGGQPKFSRGKIADVSRSNKIPLAEIKVANRSLPEFHNLLLKLARPDQDYTLIDVSDWAKSLGGSPANYYLDLFLSLTDGTVLFEDFLTNNSDAIFFNTVVRAAFDAACSTLGRRPLVTRLVPNRRAESPLWYAYPAKYRAHFAALGCRL